MTQTGIQQAKIAGEYFKRKNIVFDHAYSSTSERACDTLEYVCDMPYQRVKGLKRVEFGMFEGESEDLNPSLPYKDFFVTYGGEEEISFRKRVADTLMDIMKRKIINVCWLFLMGQAVVNLCAIGNIQVLLIKRGV